MARFISKNREEIGLSPDAYFFKGEKKIDQSLIRIIDYDPINLKEWKSESIAELQNLDVTGSVSWINVDGLHDEKVMEEIAESFDLDSLILSDVMETNSRPKIQEHDNCIFISLKMLEYDEEKDFISSENLVIIIKNHTLLSFQERRTEVFNPVRERIRKSKKRIRNSGTDYLAFCLLDTVLDHYSFTISCIGEKIENLENEILNRLNDSIIEDINRYKREINFLRRNVTPCREMIMNLVKIDSDYFNEDSLVHLKELQDNVNQAYDSLESYREILSDYLNIYHSTISNRLNDIMKFLTVFSVIFIPITFITGVYGTNFDIFPELHYKYSYLIMWIVMIVIVLIMVVYFRRKKWL